jgi:SSS family solute:Na+ symporter
LMELTIIIVYLAAMLLVGVLSQRKSKGLPGFIVANRKGSSPLITASLLATMIGGSSTIGMAGLGFSRGLTGAWWLMVGTIGLVILGIFFAGRVRKFWAYTLPGLLEKQYDGRVAVAASILIVIAWVGVTAGQIVAAGKLLSVLGMGSVSFWMIICTIVFVVYTVLGGQYSIIRTDFLQTLLIFFGVFAGLSLMLSNVGGFAGLTAALPSDHFSFPISSQFGAGDLISLFIFVGMTYLVGPDMYSRLFCAKDEGVAKVSTLTSAALTVPFALAITLIGMGAKVLFPQILPEQAFPMVMMAVLPPVLNGIVLAALLAAVMSSADTTLMSAGSILSLDIIRRLHPTLKEDKLVLISRVAIVGIGILSLLLGLMLGGVIATLLFAYTIYTCGVVCPVIAGFYRTKLGLTPQTAILAVVVGGALAVIGLLSGIEWLKLIGFAASALILLGFALLKRAK